MSTLSRIVTVFGAKGGVGRSILASNLAVALAARTKGGVALVDLDWLAGGSLASFLDLEPIKGHWGDWVYERKSFAEIVHPHASGLSLIPAPQPGKDVIPADRIVALLKLLAAKHETIVVDTCWPHISPLMVPLFDLASVVLVACTPEITTLQSTKDLLEHARDLHFPSDRLQVVLNREGITTDISADDVQATLKRPLWGRVPYHPLVVSSLNRGVPLASNAPQHPVTQAIVAIADKIRALPLVDLAARAQTELSEDAAKLARPFPTAIEASGQPPEPEPGAVPAKVDTNEILALVPHAIEREKIKEMKQKIHARLVEQMKLEEIPFERLGDPQFKAILRDQVAERANRIIEELGMSIDSRSERARLVMDISNEAIGYGPLETFLADESVSEIMVNGPQQIFVEQKGRLTLSNRQFTDEKQLRVVIDRIVAPIGRRVDESSPMVDARLPDGSRVNVIIPPLALNGSTVTIRKFSTKRLAISDLIGYASLTDPMAKFLEACVLSKLNIFISGGTGSGKTTLLNVLSGFIPSDERIVTIEDAAELKLHQEHVISLEARPANIEGSGAVHIRDLVRNSLRMRPDRIIVGEVRGGEALDMLQAMNTGHDGSLATGHANTPRDALSRLETMVLMAGMDLPVRAIREQIASAIHLIVQQTRLTDGTRKIVRISEITGMEGEVIAMQDIFEFKQTGRNQNRVEGMFRSTGMRPNCLDTIEAMGIKLPPDLFARPERV
ncbi:MAG: type secretion system protein [Cyanobacteria bacterium RYN_339]|nr:type secretion system protein [Cyanobacteria bacterium RYN_339]